MRHLSFAFLICALLTGFGTGCPTEEADDDSAGDDDTGDDDTGDDDTGDDDTTGDVDLSDPCDEEPLDAEAPDDCVPSAGTNDLWLVNGTAIVPDGALVDAEVLWSTESGEILCVDLDCSAHEGYDQAARLCADVVLPAFVDPHNHMQYNVLGPWPHGRLFENRYEWRGDPDYWDYGELDDGVDNCSAMAWAELRTLMTGSTAVAGNYIQGCDPILVRNLDEGSSHHYLPGYEPKIRTDAPDEDEEDLEGWAEDLDDGHLDAYVPHCSEGLYGTVRSEFQPLIDANLLRPETGLVHGTDLDPMQLTRMAVTGTHLIWSPQTNIDLYGRTADVTTAHTLGVPIALGPDWTLSGTAGQLFELQCVDRLNREAYRGAFCLSEMVDMATEGAAAAVGLGGVLGELAVGAKADLILLQGDPLAPWTSVLTADQTKIDLVTVDGQPLFGKADVLEAATELDPLCDELDLCGTAMRICLRGDEGDRTFAELEDDLDAELGSHLYPTFFCPDDPDYQPQWCELTVPGGTADDDEDRDGVTAADDTCPGVFDPEQRDEDGDGVGNACDPLPWEPGTSGPSMVADQDLDGDGMSNEADRCPWIWASEAHEDQDGDGIGDDCDRCPTDPDVHCAEPTHVRDWKHPLHPYEWEEVHVAGLEVTGITDAYDGANYFFAQAPGGGACCGLYVYEMTGDEVAVGDEVTLEGTYQEYYGQTEVCFGTVEVTGSTGPSTPLSFEPCDLAWFGTLQHDMEGVLVTVDQGPYEVTDVESEYGEFQIEDCLWIDDKLYELPMPSEGDEFTSITGVLRYGYNESRISPRGSGDLVE